MNISFLVFASLMLVASLTLLITARSSLIILMLLPASEFLGFLNPNLMTIRGAFDIHALMAIFILIAILFSIKHLRDFRTAHLLNPLLVLVALWLYGILKPIFNGSSSPSLALEASKEFMMIFSYFGIFLFYRTEQDIKRGWSYLIFFGLYIGFIELAIQLAGHTLLSRLTYLYRPDVFGLWKIYPQFWTVVFIPLFYYYYSFVLGISYAPLRIALSGAGLLLTFYRSYLLASLVSIPLVLFISKQGINKAILKSATLIFAIGFFGLFLMVNFGPKHILQDTGEAFLFSGAKEILGEKASGSLAGREVYAKQLRTLISQKPYFGFGFINREAALVPSLGLDNFAGRVLGFIDKGNIDVLIKFGYIGGATLYGTYAFIAASLLLAARRYKSTAFTARCLTVATTIIVYFFVQPVHASLTYSFSLLPLGIALGLLDRERLLIEKDNRSKA